MSPAAFRAAHFSQLADRCYLGTCSLAPHSSALDTAMQAMLGVMRGQAVAWPAFESEVHQLRERIAQLIGAHADQIALMPNASVGAYQVASTLAWQDRARLLHSNQEFPSIAHVWLAQAARGARPQAIDCAGRADDIVARYEQAIGRDTKLVSVPYCGYATGKRFPIAPIAAIAKRVGAKLFVDAYQALGVQKVNVDELGCDYLVGGSMKYLLGLPGVAFLYVRDGKGNDLDPQLTGWFGRKRPFDFDAATLDFPDRAARFETGTPPIPAVYAANAGLALIEQLDIDAVQSHVSILVADTTQRLLALGERLVDVAPGAGHGAHVALYEPAPERLTAFLREHAIIASPRGDAVRLSFHYFNVAEDIEKLSRALKRFRESNKDDTMRQSPGASASQEQT